MRLSCLAMDLMPALAVQDVVLCVRMSSPHNLRLQAQNSRVLYVGVLARKSDASFRIRCVPALTAL
jgi:hypothetical protein